VNESASARDVFVATVLMNHDAIMRNGTANPEARDSYAHLIRRYLTSLGCAPDMLDWAADQIHEKYHSAPVTYGTAHALADDLERIVRA
jgi:hypothetical protein